MGPDEKQELKQDIVANIEKTKKNIQALEDSTKPISPDRAIGRLSRMEAINEKSVNEAALRKAKVHLEGLKRALNQLDHEEFGECQECGGEISFKRLKAVPYSAVCLECLEAAQA